MCNEFGNYKHIFTDRYGFNNKDDIWDNEKIDYVLIGDSVIEGYCQNNQNTIAENLKKLSNKTIINLAQGAAGTLQQYAILLEYIPENVETVIWFFSDNDIIDLEEELKHPKLREYLFQNYAYQKLKTKQKKIDNLIKKLFEQEVEDQKKKNLSVF